MPVMLPLSAPVLLNIKFSLSSSSGQGEVEVQLSPALSVALPGPRCHWQSQPRAASQSLAARLRA